MGEAEAQRKHRKAKFDFGTAMLPEANASIGWRQSLKFDNSARGGACAAM
jgi:hypothetical protein